MNLRVAAALLVLLAVLGGAALMYHQQERSRQASNVATLGQPLLKGLTVADVASVRKSHDERANPASPFH